MPELEETALGNSMVGGSREVSCVYHQFYHYLVHVIFFKKYDLFQGSRYRVEERDDITYWSYKDGEEEMSAR